MSSLRPIVCKKVYYARNEEAGLDPYCYECTSHKCRSRSGRLHCDRQGFQRLHKWVYWNSTGEHADVVKQLCHNKLCLNLNHLKAFTLEEAKNMCFTDIIGRERRINFDAHPRKIKDQAVLDKLFEYSNEGRSARWISAKLGLGRDTVKSIMYHRSYRDGV